MFEVKGICTKKVITILLVVAILVTTFLVFMTLTNAAPTGSAVANNGQLKVVGNKLCNSSGSPYQLRGMSSHGLQYYGEFMNSSSIKWLRDDWKVNVVRAANYTAEKGYINNSSAMKSKVVETIDACIDAGIYGIIDWHILSDGDPNIYASQAKEFFNEMATKYADSPNVIYEICNEPNGVSWDVIKQYANQVIPVIRQADPDSVIIVGTPTWSQDVDTAASSPLQYNNLLLACHFYAGTHGQYLKDKISTAMSKGSAVFVSEWGTSTASGDGGPYTSESTSWLDFLDKNDISHVNWSLCSKNETSAALASNASKSGGWSESNLSTSGKYVRSELIKRYRSDSVTTQTAQPNSTAAQVTSLSTMKPTSSSQNNSSAANSTDTSANLSVNYVISNNWGTGANVDVTIKNNGNSTTNGWTLGWSFSGNQKISNLWNATFTQSGQTVTVNNNENNGNIPANGQVTFGFTMTYSGSNTVPTNFTIN